MEQIDQARELSSQKKFEHRMKMKVLVCSVLEFEEVSLVL
jgi:hypothetical protein